MNIKAILTECYNNLPPSIHYFGTCYDKVYRLNTNAQFWSKERIDRWQLERLKELVHYAYYYTEGYRSLYNSAGIRPEDIRSITDFKQLPFTSKEIIKSDLESFTVSPVVAGKLSKCVTGGSTGIPFSFFIDRKSAAAEYGFMNYAWRLSGWKETDWGVRLRGSHVGTSDCLYKKIGFRRYALSSNYLSDCNYEKYIYFLSNPRLSYIHAYPSTLTDLAHLMISHDNVGRLRNIKHIFLGSENLYEWQKHLIHQAFPDSVVLSWYGHSERAIWAPWCETEDKYHINPFYGYTEILDGCREVSEGEVGELIGSAFWMRGTLFLRYRTNDYAEKGMSYCPKCGRNFQILNTIDGRLSEIIVSKTGRRISLTVFAGSVMHGDAFEHIKQFRFVQKEVGKIELLIVPEASFTEEDKNNVHRKMLSFLKEDFECEIVIVEHLGKSKSGKFSYLEQHLSVDRADNILY